MMKRFRFVIEGEFEEVSRPIASGDVAFAVTKLLNRVRETREKSEFRIITQLVEEIPTKPKVEWLGMDVDGDKLMITLRIE